MEEKVKQKTIRKRVQIDMSLERYEQLREMMQTSGCESISRLYHQALKFYEWYNKKIKDGYSLKIVKDKKVTNVDLLF